jgi:hypothetical protein
MVGTALAVRGSRLALQGCRPKGVNCYIGLSGSDGKYSAFSVSSGHATGTFTAPEAVIVI